MSRRLALAALAALALAPAAARADREASPISGSFELRAGQFRPDIDSEFATVPGPYEKAFGGGRPLRLDLHLARSLWRGAGMAFEAGVGAGWFQDTGHGNFLATGQASGDRTRFRMVPVCLTATWRLEVLYQQLSIPLFPYLRASVDRYNWWVTNGADSVVKSGATDGWSWGGGVALLLDGFDRTLARELDNDTGINHTALVVDLKKSTIDDFGSKKSWTLTDSNAVTVSFGLAFVY